jgi:light-independent protochlorophyllide reductase subunit B
MFRDDHEFNDGAGASHLRASSPRPAPAAESTAEPATKGAPIVWADDAETELKKVPFFVRGKARRNTEAFAQSRNLPIITIETLYDAKAHFGR